MSKVITLSDGVSIEVDIDENDSYEISNFSSVDKSLESIQDLIYKVAKPISNTLKELNKEMSIDEVSVSLGIKVGAEGNFFVAKSSVGANIGIEMKLRAV